jgi:hypothetical protein
VTQLALLEEHQMGKRERRSAGDIRAEPTRAENKRGRESQPFSLAEWQSIRDN